MCFCTPSIRTPFCSNCNQAMFLRIKELKQQCDELQQARAICPNCSLLIDEAAGVDVAAKNQRISELEQALAVLRDRVQDEFDRTYISGVLGK